jgi:hypothetical protein
MVISIHKMMTMLAITLMLLFSFFLLKMIIKIIGIIEYPMNSPMEYAESDFDARNIGTDIKQYKTNNTFGIIL